MEPLGTQDAAVLIRLFGHLEVHHAGGVITQFRMQKSAMLLAYLAYHLPQAARRERLVEVLWSDDSLSSARGGLSNVLWSLRQDLTLLPLPSEELLRADRDTIGLNPHLVRTDVTEFQAAAQAALLSPDRWEKRRNLIRATELYRGELLQGLCEDWIFPEQVRLETQFQECVRELLSEYEQGGELAAALELALEAVRRDPLSEEPRYWLMRLYAAVGQKQSALRHYRELERLLREEFDAGPSPATKALAREIAEGGSLRLCSAGPTSDSGARTTPLPAVPSHCPEADALEPYSGAVPLDSPYYVARAADGDLGRAIRLRAGILLVTGSRQAGKTSLLARGLHQARQDRARVILTDLQMLPERALASGDTFLLALAESLAEQLDIPFDPGESWPEGRTPGLNLRRFLRREVFARDEAPLLWALDEVDRLFTCSFAAEVFGLFRSWYNERALDPGSPWSRLTLLIAYATEAHLFIRNLNHSPFNVGLRLELQDFTGEHVADLNRRYGNPLHDAEGLQRFVSLVGGHPYLVRRGLHELSRQRLALSDLERLALLDGGVYKDHLRRLVAALSRDDSLTGAVRALLEGAPRIPDESFYRLRSAGVLTGESAEEARFRCNLYRSYVQRYLSHAAGRAAEAEANDSAARSAAGSAPEPEQSRW